ncbi:Phospholipase A1 [Zostera marina]|uniref:Phospholipase A1 n=1 Tax=Zostera marina TaxID=29655 RepID=A0A0K9PM02_ZOSMR|nr:Phospholipase A1 [Zostera marina]
MKLHDTSYKEERSQICRFMHLGATTTLATSAAGQVSYASSWQTSSFYVFSRKPDYDKHATSTTTPLHTHISDLDRVLGKKTKSKSQQLTIPVTRKIAPTTAPKSPRTLMDVLGLSSLLPNSNTKQGMSPRTLVELQQLLLCTSPKLSPKTSISNRWRELHGSNGWSGLLDPLDSDLRHELVRYGEHIQAVYHAFFSTPSPGKATTVTDPANLVLPDKSYRVTRDLYATSSIEMPAWIDDKAPWLSQRSSWIGYVAVCDDEREIRRMGRRDIVIALRGTATCLEWAENFRNILVDINPEDLKSKSNSIQSQNHSQSQIQNSTKPKVECGFLTLFKTRPPSGQSLSESVVEEIQRLMEIYKGEELSISITGHSLGAALSILVADELSKKKSTESAPITVFSFGGPRVGNQGFVDQLEKKGVKVLRVVNKHDVVTRVPGLLVPGLEMLEPWAYSHVGKELRLDNRHSPFLKPNADPSCCHDLEAYLHLVDGFVGSHCPFRSNPKRSIAKLMSLQSSNMKKLCTTTSNNATLESNKVQGASVFASK